jgi:hypothetical protein
MLKNPSQKGLAEWLKVKALSSSPNTEKKKSFMNFLPGLVLSINPSDVCLSNKWNHKGHPALLRVCFFVVVVLRTSCLLGRHSTT